MLRFYRMGNNSSKTNELMIDSLVKRGTITLPNVEKAFRLTDRSNFIPSSSQNDYYRDTPLKLSSLPGGAFHPGPLHISAPDIYARILNEIDLLPGHKFLNIGSGTGYLNTVAGFLLGHEGVNHGIEHYENLVRYSEEKVEDFVKLAMPHAFDWSRPRFFCCNALCDEFLKNSPEETYDRIYCGASLSDRKQLNKLLKKLKIGGKMIVPTERDVGLPGTAPMREHLLIKFTRISHGRCLRLRLQRSVYADLISPPEGYVARELPVVIDRIPSLRDLCRTHVRNYVRNHIESSGCKPKVKNYWKEIALRNQERRNKQRIVRLPEHADSHLEVDLPPEDPILEHIYPGERPRTPQLHLRNTRERESDEEPAPLSPREEEEALERLNREVDNAPFDTLPTRPPARPVILRRRGLHRVEEDRLVMDVHQMIEEMEVFRDRAIRQVDELRDENRTAVEAIMNRNNRAMRRVDEATAEMEHYMRIHREEVARRRADHHRIARNLRDGAERNENISFLRHLPREEDLEDGEHMLELVDDFRTARPFLHHAFLDMDDDPSTDEEDRFEDGIPDEEPRGEPRELPREEPREEPREAPAPDPQPLTRSSSSSANSPSSVQENPSSPSTSSMTTEPVDFSNLEERISADFGTEQPSASTRNLFSDEVLLSNGSQPRQTTTIFFQSDEGSSTSSAPPPPGMLAVEGPPPPPSGSAATAPPPGASNSPPSTSVEGSSSQPSSSSAGPSNSQPSTSEGPSTSGQSSMNTLTAAEVEVDVENFATPAAPNNAQRVSRELSLAEVRERQERELFGRRNPNSRRRRRRLNNMGDRFHHRPDTNAQTRAPNGPFDGRPRPVAVPVGRRANGEMSFVIPALPVRRYHEHFGRPTEGARRRGKRRATQLAEEENEAAKRRRMENEELLNFLTRFFHDIDGLPLPNNLKDFIKTLSEMCN